MCFYLLTYLSGHEEAFCYPSRDASITLLKNSKSEVVKQLKGDPLLVKEVHESHNTSNRRRCMASKKNLENPEDRPCVFIKRESKSHFKNNDKPVSLFGRESKSAS